MTELFERLVYELDKRGLYRADLSRMTGLNESNFRGWRNGVMPSAEALYKVADCLGVTSEYLLTGKTDTDKDKLTVEEVRLLEIFKSLSERDRDTVLTLAKTLQKSASVTNTVTKTYNIEQ